MSSILSRLLNRYLVRDQLDSNNIVGFNLTQVFVDLIIGSILIVLLHLLNPFHVVPTGYRGVSTQFGAIKSIENEGLVILPPWQKLDVFNVRAESADVSKAEGATSDQQPVSVSLTVRYSIQPDRVAEVYEKYSRDGDLSSYVQTATQEVFKAITARFTAPELISRRVEVSNEISDALKKKVSIYGANIINIDMRNFAFSESYMSAINQKTTQEQLKLVAENELKTVEAKQKQKVTIAEAEAQAQRATADGQAYSNLTLAEASAKSLKVQNDALAQSHEVLELRRIEVDKIKAEKWNGQLPQNIYAGAPIPYIDVSTKPPSSSK